MSIIANPLSELTSVIRSGTFSQTISFTGDASETISSANGVKNFTDANVFVSNSTSSVTISGNHTTAFTQDEIKYVDKGSSDLLQTPTVITRFDQVPLNKDLFQVNQDPSSGITRTYTVVVTHSLGVNTFTFSQVVNNDVTTGYNFLQEYY